MMWNTDDKSPVHGANLLQDIAEYLDHSGLGERQRLDDNEISNNQ